MMAPDARSSVLTSLDTFAGRFSEWWKSSTGVPAVMGMSRSKRMICAEKVVTCGTSEDCGQSTEPILQDKSQMKSAGLVVVSESNVYAREVYRVDGSEVEGYVRASDRPGDRLVVDLDACSRKKEDSISHLKLTDQREKPCTHFARARSRPLAGSAAAHQPARLHCTHARRFPLPTTSAP